MKDYQGNEIKLGSYVAYISNNGMKIGRVKKIVQQLRGSFVSEHFHVTSINLRDALMYDGRAYISGSTLRRPDRTLVLPSTALQPEVVQALG